MYKANICPCIVLHAKLKLMLNNFCQTFYIKKYSRGTPLMEYILLTILTNWPMISIHLVENLNYDINIGSIDLIVNYQIRTTMTCELWYFKCLVETWVF